MSPAGGKLWRFRYRFEGKEKMLALGRYPAVRGPEARRLAGLAREAVQGGRDPSGERRAAKQRHRVAGDCRFEAVARQWLLKVATSLAASTRHKHLDLLERDVFPWIGQRGIGDVAAPDLIALVRRIEQRDTLDVARRTHNLCGRVFRYAVDQRQLEIPVATTRFAGSGSGQETG